MESNRIIVRAAGETDLASITAIYAHHVMTGSASFELAAPDVDEMRRRHREIVECGLPYLVASFSETPTLVAGYAYASVYRTRPGYRYTLEDSVYVDAASAGRGVGRALLAEVIGACERLGYRQMLAVIGGSDNAASIGVHAALGFTHAGRLHAVGRKFERWVDTVIMQRTLGAGSTEAP